MSVSATASPRSEPQPERRREGLRLPQYLGYGAGDAANNLAFSLTSMFLLLYYTDVVGIAATTVGTLFLVVRVFDAFADLFAGRVVDKRIRAGAASGRSCYSPASRCCC